MQCETGSSCDAAMLERTTGLTGALWLLGGAMWLPGAW